MTLAARPYDFLGPPLTAARGNVTAAVTEQLRRAIITLELKPGEVLDKGAICTQLGVSRFPVSEALARLQADGLVDIQPQRGSIVSRVRIADVEEYMLIRKALEAEAVRVLIDHRTAPLVAALRQNLDDQHATTERETFHQLDLAFHALLQAGMRFDKLKAVIETARANLDRARRLAVTPRRLAVSIAEHEEIFAGIAAGDAPAAAAAMRAHIDSAMADLFTLATERPELFADGSDPRATTPPGFPFG
jgi:DNA-binding GntR family transcriptional regulator